MRIVLASQSPYRQIQLQNFGLVFIAAAPRVDEEALKASGPWDLEELTRFLATEKAKSLASEFTDAVILGADQVVEFDGERLDKPGSLPNAAAQLGRLQGKTHRLITSLAVLHKAQKIVTTTIAHITMKPLTKETIEAYCRVDQPIDCAGAYKIEKAGLSLIEKIDCADPSSIQGLPLIALADSLAKIGLSLPELWRLK